MNLDIKRLIGKYLLPSFEDVKEKKLIINRQLFRDTYHIKFYLDSDSISPDGGLSRYSCKNFTNKKYNHVLIYGLSYWTVIGIGDELIYNLNL